MKKTLLTIILIVFCAENIFAQNADIFLFKDKINLFFEQIIIEKDDSVKQNLNDSIKTCLNEILLKENSFSVDFQDVKYLGKITSPDNLLNIFTWNIPLGNRMLFSGFVQTNDGKIFELKTAENTYKPTENQQITLENWYGALYYKIVPFKYEKRKIYALAGWSRYQNDTEVKLLEVLDFQGDNIIFGLPVFENEDETKFRAVFEYDFRTGFSLNYNSKKKRFEFDHISPMKVDENQEVISFGIDMSVDGYRLKGEKWVFVEDLNVRNAKN